MESRYFIGPICLLSLAACTGSDAPTETTLTPIGGTAATGGTSQIGGASTPPMIGGSGSAGAAPAAGNAGTASTAGGMPGGGNASGGSAGSAGAAMCLEITQPCETEQECCGE